MKIVVTGANGLIGWHAAARIHALNCAAKFKSKPEPFELVMLDRAGFNTADAVLHFAGVNRAADEVVETQNVNIAQMLADACIASDNKPHIVYANTTHSGMDTPYGRAKKKAGEILSTIGGGFTDMILPHIFGEYARPNYNNVTATFIDSVIKGHRPEINPDGKVALLHVGTAAQAAIDAAVEKKTGQLTPEARLTPVPELYETLKSFHESYTANIFPDLNDPFDVALFNSYRSALYPNYYPSMIKQNTDPRGTLFEAFKGGGGGQAFASWTKPGITRGDHFHVNKIERFLVIQGEAVIRIRKVLSDDVIEFPVTGDAPSFIDMPTLHTHSIENVGDSPLLTLFWSNELFDPKAPDTYADTVLRE
jgi:UDP-2-acetamido-2,6-beta-L-arabino-hexul-4-ose reductase